jgi:hypothetical protein
MSDVVDNLMRRVAEYYGISVDELKHRITVGGETLVHQYYVSTYGEDSV